MLSFDCDSIKHRQAMLSTKIDAGNHYDVINNWIKYCYDTTATFRRFLALPFTVTMA